MLRLKDVDFRLDVLAELVEKKFKELDTFIESAFVPVESTPTLTTATTTPTTSDYKPRPRAHGGFWDAINLKREGHGRSVMEEVLDFIKKIDEQSQAANEPLKKIYITGHSLGGALR